MWKPDLHPRDEYGRFRLSGQGGAWDRLAGRVEVQAHARAIAEYHAAGRELGRFPNINDPAARPAVERSRAAKRALPEAFFAGGMPGDDGFWRDRRNRPTNAFGELLPPMLTAGAVRVGDHPGGRGIGEGRGAGAVSSQANGVWHRPGEYGPGRVPILRNDWGHPMTQLEPEPSRSRRDRSHRGAFVRGEIKASERLYGGEGYEKEVRRRGREVRTSSAEVHGAYQNDPRNPVGRMRTAPGHRRRRQRTTWIQRLNAQMEGR